MGKQLFVTSSPSFEHVGNINQITTSHLHNYSGTLQITAFKDFLCAKNLDCFLEDRRTPHVIDSVQSGESSLTI